jgi:uncharacterized protein
MSDNRPVGLTKGPGEAPHDFTFVSPDRERCLKIGEYIIYEANVDGADRQVLSRIIERRPLRQYPDAFLADPAIGPNQVAALVGFERQEHELFELTATVIGYYDDEIADFINPRLPPREGNLIYLASDELLTRLLSRKQPGQTGSAHVGSLLSREAGRVPVVTDVAALVSTHTAIIASTGAGKSYLAGVLLEELMSPYNRAAVLVVDPHGEYDTLAEMANMDHFQAGPYRPEVKIYQPGAVKVRVSALEVGDLSYLLPNLSDRMYYLLARAYRDVRRASNQENGNPDQWTRNDLEARLVELGENEEGDNAEKKPDFSGTADALIWRLDSVLRNSTIFDDFDHLNLGALCRPGQCSVLQLNEVDEKEQQVMVATLLRRLLKARTDTIKGKAIEGEDLYLPYPVFVLIEEAHRFAPASANVVSTGILKTILSEGRKFGVGIGLISQRPGKLDGDVLSQCNSQFIMRIVNPVDQARVAESVETVGRDLLRELPALTKGQVIIAGEAVSTPVISRVRKRRTRHGGETHDAPGEWMGYFSQEEQERRDRESAPLAQGKKGGSRMFK